MIPVTEQKLQTSESMDEINALLRHTAKRKGCKVSDLEWKRGKKFGEIHIRLRNQEVTKK